MKTVYRVRTNLYSGKADDVIEPVLIEKETRVYVFMECGAKIMKRPSYGEQYFSTHEAAVDFLREEAARDLSHNESNYAGLEKEYQDKKAQLERAIKEGKKRLARINSLTTPA
jgi:hypothetical protein